MPVVVSFIFLFAMIYRTKPNIVALSVHVLLHLIMMALLQPDYVIHYLIVMFFSSPVQIRCTKHRKAYGVLFATLPCFVATIGFALTR